MAFGVALGPVFAFEWLTATRRWTMYAWRSAFVGLILLGLAMVWASSSRRADLAQIKVQAEIARQFYSSTVVVALLMVLLAAPAATAGAVCVDKARGSLFHIFVTDLSDAEIVLGKLAARLVPVLGLIACSLPVMALLTLLGGVDPVALTGSFVVLVGLALLGCTLALALSVWGKKTHEVLLAAYFVWVVWSLLVPGVECVSWYLGAGMNAPDWIAWSNPFVLALGGDPSTPGYVALGIQLLFLAGAVVVSAALVALTVRRLRPVVVGQWGRVERSRRAGFTLGLGPTLDGNPVLWREWHRRRPSPWARIIWGLYIVLVLGFDAMAVDLAWSGRPRGGFEAAFVITGLQVAIGLLLLSVSSATSLSEERSRGSLDVLLVTPLSTASILWGKWWGAYRGVILVAILPALIAACGCRQGRWIGVPLVLGLVLAYGATITSLGLALATWIRQTGRVLALCVALYVAFSVGWAVWLMMLIPQLREFCLLALMGSPFFGIFVLSALIAESGPGDLWPACAVAAFVWILINATAAAALMAAAFHAFDRSMGRVSLRASYQRQARTAAIPRKTEVGLEAL
jgi:ABC-type transport system involved in multi-copper enzyme maturation permease subunit